MSDWIKVSDRLPEVERDYICTVKRFVTSDPFVNVFKFRGRDSGMEPGFYEYDVHGVDLEREYDITHWQPLPEPAQ